MGVRKGGVGVQEEGQGFSARTLPLTRAGQPTPSLCPDQQHFCASVEPSGLVHCETRTCLVGQRTCPPICLPNLNCTHSAISGPCPTAAAPNAGSGMLHDLLFSLSLTHNKEQPPACHDTHEDVSDTRLTPLKDSSGMSNVILGRRSLHGPWRLMLNHKPTTNQPTRSHTPTCAPTGPTLTPGPARDCWPRHQNYQHLPRLACPESGRPWSTNTASTDLNT